MFILFGARAMEIRRVKIEETCTKCGAPNSLNAVVHQNVVHVFYAPLFPNGKTGYIYCSNCNYTVEIERLNPHFRNLYLEAQNKVKTPWWSFAAIFGIAVLISISIVVSFVSSGISKKYAAAPRIDDTYEVELGHDAYTLYRVTDVSEDSVKIIRNLYETDSQSGLVNLEQKGYNGTEYSLSKKDILEMFERNEIKNVRRKLY